MEIFFIAVVISLFILAAFDLYVGVSNDAVNFLNSAIGSKAARFRTLLIVASVGVFSGCILSNGMMDIARHGIFHPTQFSFEEVMIIYVAVMVTDIVLLDIFNTFGMPTSTTVSMVFELLGAAFALTMVKMMGAGALDFGDYLNSDKAIQVMLGIFLSVPLAFVFGALVQYVARLVFTFHYKPRMRYTIGLFGGVAITGILYFMLFKGMKDLSFMTPELLHTMETNLPMILLGSFVAFTILCQLLHVVGVNVFRVIVLVGTFALATAFAGNDLVNFIGVPLAGFSAFLDFSANGSGDAATFMMTSLEGSAKTSFIFLLAAGAIMVFALVTSKKAQRVTKTEVGLSTRREGEELFGSSNAARSIVRFSRRVAEMVARLTPAPVAQWVDRRFAPAPEDPEFSGAAYDLVRASVNLCMAALLIALGTSLKLPLSTTFVTFMIAMGSSLADRAWTRESAVFRITGVLNVIGGWFMTAGAAFVAAFLIALAIYHGGGVAMFALIALSLGIVLHGQFKAEKESSEEREGDVLFQTMLNTEDRTAVNRMLCRHLMVSTAEMVERFAQNLTHSTDGLMTFSLKPLRHTARSMDTAKRELKNLRRRETLCLRRVDEVTSLRLSTPFHLVHNALRQILGGVLRITDSALEHVDNNFTPIDAAYALRFTELRRTFIDRTLQVCVDLRAERYDALRDHRRALDLLRRDFRAFRHDVLADVQDSTKAVNLTSINLLLHITQETEQLVREVRSLTDHLRHYRELM